MHRTSVDPSSGPGPRPRRREEILLLAALAAVALLAFLASTARGDGVTVALLPDSQVVQPGDTLVVELRVTQAGAAFNGYDATVGYDPAALTFLPTSPLSLQEGSYMTGACGNTFHYFVAGPDSLTISHVLLCSGVDLTGPGQLYRLRFKARDVLGTTWVRLRHVQFYDAGFYVNPAHPSDAQAVVGGPVAVPPGRSGAGTLRLVAAPNPFRSTTVLELAGGGIEPRRIEILDLAGRAVRHFGDVPASAQRVAWDGRDDAGVRLPAGIYHVLARAGGRTASARLALLP